MTVVWGKTWGIIGERKETRENIDTNWRQNRMALRHMEMIREAAWLWELPLESGEKITQNLYKDCRAIWEGMGSSNGLFRGEVLTGILFQWNIIPVFTGINCTEKSRIKVWKVLKQDASWKKCDWDYKHGISSGRGKWFSQEDGGMEMGRSRRRQAWRSRIHCNSAVYRNKCCKVSTKSVSKLQLSWADHAIKNTLKEIMAKGSEIKIMR